MIYSGGFEDEENYIELSDNSDITLSEQYKGKTATFPLGDLPDQWMAPENGKFLPEVGGRIHAMTEAVVLKFWAPANQHLAMRLVSTGATALVETNPKDYFWARTC
jgi:hypothetical protein